MVIEKQEVEQVDLDYLMNMVTSTIKLTFNFKYRNYCNSYRYSSYYWCRRKCWSRFSTNKRIKWIKHNI